MLKKIIFRCDSNPDIGLGHLTRCISIGRELKGDNDVIFATISDKTNSKIENELFRIFLKENFETEELFLLRIVEELEPDVIVLDKKYPYSKDIIIQLKSLGIKIIILDHICDGISEADEVIFPNAHLDNKRLNTYLSEEKMAKVKFGPEYVIIRDEILRLKDKEYTQFNRPIVVVTTGGSDPEGVLIKIIPWLIEGKFDADFRILIGESFQHRNKLEYFLKNLPDNFKIMDYSPQEFVNANLVICTFGITLYEMIYLDKNIISISHSLENDSVSSSLSQKFERIENLGYINDLNFKILIKTINKILNESSYKILSDNNNNLINGLGAVRIGKIIRGDE
ncbi:hypothetical protein [Methanobacterium formicicum]|uniref:Polysaccharide biosynthesis protein, glycosyltransferase n=1 Tax=Methanobacterium formicicum (strain DSM 3637 / PP1) TaxID=1204725 RepID=K2R0G5_METFP|nr:hypothetical protein [Methanobacterium formicicum]EKF86033.1 polysaccharide biosynthesis protein, glycosyltransferase [Methanobacterium formicicum DSM 3637]